MKFKARTVIWFISHQHFRWLLLIRKMFKEHIVHVYSFRAFRSSVPKNVYSTFANKSKCRSFYWQHRQSRSHLYDDDVEDDSNNKDLLHFRSNKSSVRTRFPTKVKRDQLFHLKNTFINSSSCVVFSVWQSQVRSCKQTTPVPIVYPIYLA